MAVAAVVTIGDTDVAAVVDTVVAVPRCTCINVPSPPPWDDAQDIKYYYVIELKTKIF